MKNENCLLVCFRFLLECVEESWRKSEKPCSWSMPMDQCHCHVGRISKGHCSVAHICTQYLLYANSKDTMHSRADYTCLAMHLEQHTHSETKTSLEGSNETKYTQWTLGHHTLKTHCWKKNHPTHPTLTWNSAQHTHFYCISSSFHTSFCCLPGCLAPQRVMVR